MADWGWVMLQKLDEHIRVCIDRAVDAHEQAMQTSDLRVKEQHLEMAARWRRLARSYEFVESLNRFLLESERKLEARPPEPPEE